jgi:hypothetical protein
MRQGLLFEIAAALASGLIHPPAGAQVMQDYRIRCPMRAAPAQCCGPDCLYLCFSLNGIDNVSLPDLESALGVGAKGCSLGRLAAVAKGNGLTAVTAHVNVTALAELGCPAILHVNGNHFIVFLEDRDGRLLIFDDLVGLFDCSHEWFDQVYNWPGECLLIRPNRFQVVLGAWRPYLYMSSVVMATFVAVGATWHARKRRREPLS